MFVCSLPAPSVSIDCILSTLQPRTTKQGPCACRLPVSLPLHIQRPIVFFAWAERQLFDAHIPLVLTPTPTGPQYENVFASEFGYALPTVRLLPHSMARFAAVAFSTAPSAGADIEHRNSPNAAQYSEGLPAGHTANYTSLYFGRIDRSVHCCSAFKHCD